MESKRCTLEEAHAQRMKGLNGTITILKWTVVGMCCFWGSVVLVTLFKVVTNG